MQASANGYNPTYSEQAPTPEQVSATKGYMILEFGAPWCGHCQMAADAIKQALSTRDVPHVKIFDGKGKKLGRSFAVKLWPTLILLNSGEEVARLVRPTRLEQVEELLASIQ